MWVHRLAALVLLCIPTVVSALPSIDQLLADLPFTADDLQKVRNGELVTKDATETSDRELAVAMAFLIKDPPAKVAELFDSGSDFRLDSNLAAYGELDADPTAADLSGIVLQPNGDAEAQRYLNAAPGDTLNLSPAEIAGFDAMQGADAAAVEQQIRRNLLARLADYRAKGLDGIAPYARSSGNYDPAADLRSGINAVKALRDHAPQFRDVLLNWPQDAPTGLQSQFFWLRYGGDRPNFTLRHRISLASGTGFVATDREFYVAHDYNETQAISAALPAAEGTLVIYVDRTSTDQAAGFGSSMKHSIGRSMMAKQIAAIFEKVRASAQ